MTPEQVALVQGSFADLGLRTGDLAARFYRLLFEADPSLRSMFSADPRVQESVFASELAVVVRSILRFDEFVARARELGARHVGYGVTYAHYEIAGGVLLVVLEKRSVRRSPKRCATPGAGVPPRRRDHDAGCCRGNALVVSYRTDQALR